MQAWHALASAHNQSNQQFTYVVEASFLELWRLEIFLIGFLVIAGYLFLVGKWREDRNLEEVPRNKQIYFILGVSLFMLVKASPLNYYGHNYLFTAHMLQMAIIFIVIPPLLWLGVTQWMVQPFLDRFPRVSRVLSHPLLSIAMFNSIFSLYHLPIVFDTMMSHHALHTLFYIILFCGAMLMWWPLMYITTELQSMSGLRKILYLFVGGVLLTPVCVLIVFAPNPLFATYMDAPQLFRHMSVLEDQQLGGVLMKAIQEITYITAMAIIFFRWARTERQKDHVDPSLYMPQHMRQQKLNAETEQTGNEHQAHGLQSALQSPVKNN